jgi:hypothetical protein
MTQINNIHATAPEYFAATKQVLDTPEYTRICKKVSAFYDKKRKIEKRERAASDRRFKIATDLISARKSGCYSDVTGPLEAKKAELDAKIETLRFKEKEAHTEALRYLDAQIALREELLTLAGLPLAWFWNPIAR